MSKKNILLTGAEGYIGTNMMNTYKACKFRPFDIANKIPTIPQDVRDYKTVEKYVKHSCDGIIHLAGISGIIECENDPVKAYTTNITGTLNIARAASRKGIPFVLASSFAAADPINIYGASKRIAEKITTEYGGVALRLANVYGGPNYLEKKNSVIAYLLKCLNNEENPVIHDGGMHARDFIHVFDVCKAFICGLKTEPGIYNVCTGKQTFIKEIVEVLGFTNYGSISNPRSDVEFKMLPNWSAKMSLKDGLAELNPVGKANTS